MRNIKISQEVSFPLDVVTQTIAILAKRRVGKSYTMRRIGEQLLDANQQVVIVDPKGDQWGIRSSVDGKKPGYPIVILGGEHGDAPLEVNSGEIVAKLVVEERVSVLLDLSSFRKYEIAIFMEIFLENLYRLKAQEKYRTPVMLIVDEADAIAPQRPQKGEERMLGAIEDVVRRGGQRGLGCILITQRSAVLNKNVLTQAQILIVLRTIAPQDLSAMNAWIDVHGEPEQRKILMDSLPSLPVGEAWVWSPGWPTNDGIFKRVKVLPITTFDSAATPKPGEKKIVPKNLADVDLEAIKKQMADTIEKAKKDDPKLLRKRIAELEAKDKVPPVPVSTKASDEMINRAVAIAIKDKDKKFEAERKLYHVQIKSFSVFIKRLGDMMTNLDIVIPEEIKESVAVQEFVSVGKENGATYLHAEIPRMGVNKESHRVPSEVEERGEEKLDLCPRKIYSFLFANPTKSFSRVQLGVVTGYSPNSGGFKNALSRLNSSGLIRKEGAGIKINIVDSSLVLDEESEKYSPELWFSKLEKCQREIFKVLWDNPQQAFTKDELSQMTATPYSPTSGGFKNALSRLSSLGLLVRLPPASVSLNEELLDL